MAEFVIKAADERGHLLQQVERGYSEAEVRERFVQQGYLVYWVKPRGLFSAGEMPFSRGRKIRQGRFVIFNQQFLTLIKAGLPILTSLDLLIKRQKDPHMRSVLENVRDRVKSGELLSDSFAAQAVFPKIYTTTLLAGEKSGNMEEVLSRYIAFQRMSLTFKKKLAVSLVYPTLLVVMVICHVHFPDHLCGAAVCPAVPEHGRATTGHHAAHAQYRHARAKIWAGRRHRVAGSNCGAVALAQHRPRSGAGRPRRSEDASNRAKSG